MSENEPNEQPESAEPAEEAAPAYSREELKLALKAFHKRLRLTRLDDESKIGGGAMSGGRTSGVVAISPPQQFPDAIWDELVKKGKLAYAGQGLYESLVYRG